MSVFKEILQKYMSGTDKLNGFYEIAYEDAFLSERENIKLLFEIGVCNGGGLRAFRDYFPNAQIVGLEINSGYHFEEERIKVEICNACDPGAISRIIDKYGQPDIVVDDGSHISDQIIAVFSLLYPRTNFCYVIEDLATQYPSFHGGVYLRDIPATVLIYDKMNNLLEYGKGCKSIKMWYGICFLFK